MRKRLKGKGDVAALEDTKREKESSIEVLEDTVAQLKVQLKQKDLDIYRLKAQISDSYLNRFEEEREYPCGRDHDKTGTYRATGNE